MATLVNSEATEEQTNVRKEKTEAWKNVPSSQRVQSSSVAFQDVHVHGFSKRTDFQTTFASFPVAYLGSVFNRIRRVPETRIDILKGLEGLVLPGEMLLVLGKPGSGCTTFLKTLAGQSHGVQIGSNAVFNFQGFSTEIMHGKMRGQCIYQAETDVHFPTLTMRETLDFGTSARNSRIHAGERDERVSDIASRLGLSKALDTKMGNSFVRGVSGGERKRTSIAEILVGDSNFQCWDNSTAGLDSANAIEFLKLLRQETRKKQGVAIVTLYQASDEIYKLFDKVTVLYEGQQTYFGPAHEAKAYFTSLGYLCSSWSSIPDFLVSVTKPEEREVIPNFDASIPMDAASFANTWQASSTRAELHQQIQEYHNTFPVSQGVALSPDRHNSSHLPYSVSVPSQISLCVGRGFKRLFNDLNAPIAALIGNCVISIILGSMFYNMSDDTGSFYGRGMLLFLTIFLNSALTAFESVAIWDVRPMIEKHFRYAFHRPYAEAMASVLVDLPNKILLSILFNLPVYFLANLRRTPTAFFTFYLFAFVALLNGSMIYRSMGAMSRTSEGSQPAGAVFALLLVLYSGFVIPFKDMRPWLKWFSYINPVYYGFESLAINEFSGRTFACSQFIPEGVEYTSVQPNQRACTAVGAASTSDIILGDTYIYDNWGFKKEHLWRNLGIMIALMVFYGLLYLFCTEYISLQPSRGEVLLFPRSHKPRHRPQEDIESGNTRLSPNHMHEETMIASDLDKDFEKSKRDAATFVWNDLSYDIKVGKTTRRILDDVEGWVKPGTMTALLGASGAGKTTLLNVLADRTSIGVVHGQKLVAARFQDFAFARKIGYAQQQDLHLNTMTVREALQFSAILRQPPYYTIEAKLAWVNRVISLLDMDKDGFVDAIIGVPGEGLNVEQRKRVTIGVELAARPELLLFLDEPTSGLDSTSSMSIIRLLRRLADNGQAILCVVHQPSTALIAHFDRLLVLSQGKEVYFGNLGNDFETLVHYFERHGAPNFQSGDNPAEWMLDIVSRSSDEPEDHKDWADIWRNSDERAIIKTECKKMQLQLAQDTSKTDGPQAVSEFATDLCTQLLAVTRRAYQHEWRSPTYIWSKFFTTFGVTFINGVTFWRSKNTPQDIQNQVISLFLLTTLFGAHVQLILKRFHESRSLYEVQDRPSRAYSWIVFLVSNILVELSSQTVVSVIAYVCWYYPIGFWRHASEQNQLDERGWLTFLFIWSLMILFQTLSQMLMTIMPDVPTAINNANLLFMLSLIFSGVIVSPNALPRFWIFMYRATPLSYYISGIMSTGLSALDIQCQPHDIVHIPEIPSGETCSSYLASYISSAGGKLLNLSALADCQFCPYAEADALLAGYGMFFANRWRDWGITIAYNVINVGLTFLLYWAFRVPKGTKNGQKSESTHTL